MLHFIVICKCLPLSHIFDMVMWRVCVAVLSCIYALWTIKKRATKLFVHKFSHILTDFENVFTDTATTCDKTVIKDFTTPNMLCYLVKYQFSKIASTEAQQWQTKRTWTEENVIMVGELVLSQQDQPQIYHSVHQTAKAGVTWIIFFLISILVWSV